LFSWIIDDLQKWGQRLVDFRQEKLVQTQRATDAGLVTGREWDAY
jgi:hypothetical protein